MLPVAIFARVLGLNPLDLASLSAWFRADRIGNESVYTNDFSTEIDGWSGSVALEAGELKATGTTVGTFDAGLHDYVYEIDESRGGVGGIAGNYTSTSDYWRIYQSSNILATMNDYHGGDTDTFSVAMAEWTIPNVRRWKVAKYGKYRRVWLDAEWLFDQVIAADHYPAQAGTGLGIRASGAIAGRWDDMAVRTVDPATDMVLASDTFPSGDTTLAGTTTETGNISGGYAWANVSGKINLDISTNTVTPTAAGLAWGVFDVGEADLDLRLSFTPDTLESSLRAGIVYRYVDASNYCRAVYVQSTGDIYLQAVLAGVPAQTITAWAPVAGETYEMRVVATGDEHHVFIDDVPYGSLSSSNNNTATSVGIELQRTIALNVVAHSLSVSPAPHVTAWPDLSGADQHAVAADIADAPLLLPGITDNGKAGVAFSGGQSLDIDGLTLTQPFTLAASGRMNANNQYITGGYTASTRAVLARRSTGVWFAYAGAGLDGDTAAATTARLSAVFDGTGSELITNGTSYTATAGTQDVSGLYIGHSYVPGSYLDGEVSELIALDADHSVKLPEIDTYLDESW